MRIAHQLSILGLGIAAAAAAIGASGQTPAGDSRPVTLVVPIAAGGGVDTIGRIFAAQLADRFQQPWVVENRPGAGGLVGLDSVAKATADGHTMVVMETSAVLQKWLHKNVPFDVVADFAAVAQMATTPLLLFANPSLPAANIKELIAYAKANPGKLNYASQGIGTTSHLTTELFETITHTQLVHVPYKGTAPALNDLIASHVDLMFNELATSIELNKAGKAKILAVATKQRVAAIPDVPTLEEAGVAGCESDTWNALTAPPKTPAGAVAKLNDAANQVMKDPELLDRYKQLSLSAGGGTVAQMSDFLKAETQRWGAVIKAAGIQPE